jgi:quinol monooxygenase YgiN
MVITLYTYRVKPTHTHAATILSQQWQKERFKSCLISAELFSDIHDPDEMMLLVRFPDEEAAWSFAECADNHAWYAQLARITEEGPAVSQYKEVYCESGKSI